MFACTRSHAQIIPALRVLFVVSSKCASGLDDDYGVDALSGVRSMAAGLDVGMGSMCIPTEQRSLSLPCDDGVIRSGTVDRGQSRAGSS